MSGASGSILAAIQVTPEAICGGTIGKIKNGDMISIDAEKGTLAVAADDNPESREPGTYDLAASHTGMGRDLFAAFRKNVNGAESGATIFGD
jgi:phosphogluconate dehydratase